MSHHCCLAQVPDHISAKIVRLVPSTIDAVRLSGVCRQLRHLVFTQWNVSNEFATMELYCGGGGRGSRAVIGASPNMSFRQVLRNLGDDNIHICNSASQICQFPLSDETKLRSVLLWLFVICTPDQLHLFVNRNLMEALVDALPVDQVLHVKRMKLHLEQTPSAKAFEWIFKPETDPCSSESVHKRRRPNDELQDKSDIIKKLLQHLPPDSLTHLELYLRTIDTSVFADWLLKANKLQALLQTRSAVLTKVSALPQLKAINLETSFGRPEIMPLDCDADGVSLHHLCGCHLLAAIPGSCKPIPEQMRLKITSFCCMVFFNPFNTLKQLFPNCRRIEYKNELKAGQLDIICHDYREMQSAIDREEEPNILKIFLYVDPSNEPVVEFERSWLVEIYRRPRSGHNGCAIRREFD